MICFIVLPMTWQWLPMTWQWPQVFWTILVPTVIKVSYLEKMKTLPDHNMVFFISPVLVCYTKLYKASEAMFYLSMLIKCYMDFRVSSSTKSNDRCPFVGLLSSDATFFDSRLASVISATYKKYSFFKLHNLEQSMRLSEEEPSWAAAQSSRWCWQMTDGLRTKWVLSLGVSQATYLSRGIQATAVETTVELRLGVCAHPSPFCTRAIVLLLQYTCSKIALELHILPFTVELYCSWIAYTVKYSIQTLNVTIWWYWTV